MMSAISKRTPLCVVAATAVSALLLSACGTLSEPTLPQHNGVSNYFIGKTAHGGAIGENTIADLAQEAVKSVVNIDTTTNVAVPDYQIPFFELFGQEPLMPHVEKFQMRGTGSGVIIRPDGYILTNNHVVGNAQQIKVTLNSKQVLSGSVVGRDSFTDLALVKINANNLPTAKLGSVNNLRPGDFVVAIGSPAGLSNTVTFGIISALGRSLGEELGDVGLVQTDAAINPGNSGGPLLNIHGEVIAINTAIRKNYQNIGFGIPIDVAKQVAEQLLKSGSIKHPYLGISMQDLNDQIDKALGLPPGRRGVVIAKVTAGSPADDAGLATGDLILKVDGKTVLGAKDVQTIVRAHKPGDSLPIEIQRNGQPTTVTLTVGEFPQKQQQQQPNE